jgi:hypothetical protein
MPKLCLGEMHARLFFCWTDYFQLWFEMELTHHRW